MPTETDNWETDDLASEILYVLSLTTTVLRIIPNIALLITVFNRTFIFDLFAVCLSGDMMLCMVSYLLSLFYLRLLNRVEFYGRSVKFINGFRLPHFLCYAFALLGIVIRMFSYARPNPDAKTFLISVLLTTLSTGLLLTSATMQAIFIVNERKRCEGIEKATWHK